MIRTGEVFPPRNLSDESTPWGREVETRIANMELVTNGTDTGLKSENRNTASVTANLARQAVKLEGILEGLEDLYKSIPKDRQTVVSETGYGVGTGWTTVASATMSPPSEGASRVTVTAFGNTLTFGNSGIQADYGIRSRIVIAGNASGSYEASITPLGYWQAVSNSQHGREINTPSSVSVSLQMQATSGGVYSSDSRNRATLTVLASWTG